MLETENLNTKLQPIRMKELSVIAIYTQIASGHILLAVLRLRFFQKLKRFRHSFLHVQLRCYDAHLLLISSILEQAKVFKTYFFDFDLQRSKVILRSQVIYGLFANG